MYTYVPNSVPECATSPFPPGSFARWPCQDKPCTHGNRKRASSISQNRGRFHEQTPSFLVRPADEVPPGFTSDGRQWPPCDSSRNAEFSNFLSRSALPTSLSYTPDQVDGSAAGTSGQGIFRQVRVPLGLNPPETQDRAPEDGQDSHLVCLRGDISWRNNVQHAAKSSMQASKIV